MVINKVSAGVNLHLLMVFLYDWDQLISMYKSLILDHCTIPSESRLILPNGTVYFLLL